MTRRLIVDINPHIHLFAQKGVAMQKTAFDIRPILACGMALLIGFFIGRALVQKSPEFVHVLQGINESITEYHPSILFAKLRR